MNQMKYIAFFTLTICMLASCKKQELLTYDIQDNIYFNYKNGNNQADSTEIAFAIRPDAVKDSTFKLPIAVTGTAKDQDRIFKVMVVDSNTTAISGQHFILPPTFTVRAGRILDSLPVKLLRSSDLQNKGVEIKLMLQPNENFNTNIKILNSNVGAIINALTFKLKISDFLIAGKYWAGSFQTPFGNFSAKKLRLIHQVTGMPLDYNTSFLSDLQNSARIPLYAITMSHYLADEKAAGRTVYEDDGITEMKMGITYQ